MSLTKPLVTKNKLVDCRQSKLKTHLIEGRAVSKSGSMRMTLAPMTQYDVPISDFSLVSYKVRIELSAAILSSKQTLASAKGLPFSRVYEFVLVLSREGPVTESLTMILARSSAFSRIRSFSFLTTSCRC